MTRASELPAILREPPPKKGSHVPQESDGPRSKNLRLHAMEDLYAPVVRRLQGGEGSPATPERTVSQESRSRRRDGMRRICVRRRTKRAARSRPGSMAAIRYSCSPPIGRRSRRCSRNIGSGRTPRPAEQYQVGTITATIVQGQTFGDWRIADITREALDAFRAQRPKVAANRNLAFLRAMFNWAVVDGLVPGHPSAWAMSPS